MPLVPLEEFNQACEAAYAQANGARSNGIACPDCGSELIDDQPHYVFASSPPSKSVACPSCGYRGHRLT